MAIYTVKEFAQLTGFEPKQIHTYAGRGKVVKNPNKKIDTSDSTNLEFFENHRINGIVPHETPKQIKKAPKIKGEKEEVPEINERQQTLQEKSKVELELKRMELEQKQLEYQKKRGELVNLNDTINTITEYSNNLKKELLQNLQTFIQDICARHNIESGKAGQYKEKLPDIINKSSKKSVQILKDKL